MHNLSRPQVNGHSLERMKDVSSAAKMLNELKDQSDTSSVPGSPVSSSNAETGATQLVLILSRGAADHAGKKLADNGNASRKDDEEMKQLPPELQKCEFVYYV